MALALVAVAVLLSALAVFSVVLARIENKIIEKAREADVQEDARISGKFEDNITKLREVLKEARSVLPTTSGPLVMPFPTMPNGFTEFTSTETAAFEPKIPKPANAKRVFAALLRNLDNRDEYDLFLDAADTIEDFLDNCRKEAGPRWHPEVVDMVDVVPKVAKKPTLPEFKEPSAEQFANWLMFARDKYSRNNIERGAFNHAIRSVKESYVDPCYGKGR